MIGNLEYVYRLLIHSTLFLQLCRLLCPQNKILIAHIILDMSNFTGVRANTLLGISRSYLVCFLSYVTELPTPKWAWKLSPQSIHYCISESGCLLLCTEIMEYRLTASIHAVTTFLFSTGSFVSLCFFSCQGA